jgi:hypothetical protein
MGNMAAAAAVHHGLVCLMMLSSGHLHVAAESWFCTTSSAGVLSGTDVMRRCHVNLKLAGLAAVAYDREPESLAFLSHLCRGEPLGMNIRSHFSSC